MSRKLDLMTCWNDVRRLLSTDREVIVAVAGVCQFLPALAFGLMVAGPDTTGAEGFDQAMAIIREFIAANWPWLLGVSLLSMIGSLAILALLLRGARFTVGEAFRYALALLPAYFAASLISGLAIAGGLFLFILPGIYLALRFLLIGAVAAGEDQRSPMQQLRRSWELTAGNVLPLLIYFAVVIAVGLVAMTTVGLIANILFDLTLGEDIATPLSIVVETLTSTILGVVILVSYAAIYRRLAVAGEAG